MMDISCEVIQDILPLYAEDMVSVPTRELVDGHLCLCEDCTQKLANLLNTKMIPVDDGIGALQRVKKTIKMRRVLSIFAVLATLLSFVMSLFLFMSSTIYLPADKAVEGVYLQEDGGLVIDYARGNTGSSGIISVLGGMESFCCTTTRYDWLKGRILDKKLESMTREQVEEFIKDQYQVDQLTQGQIDRFYDRDVQYNFINEAGKTVVYTRPELDTGFLEHIEDQLGHKGDFVRTEHNYNIGYLAPDGSVSTILWNGGGEEGIILDATSNSGKYLWEEVFFGCIIGAIALGSWYYVGKKENRREWKIVFMLVLGCAAFAIGLVSNCTFNFTALRESDDWMGRVLVEAPTLFVTALLWRKLHNLKKHDKGL